MQKKFLCLMIPFLLGVLLGTPVWAGPVEDASQRIKERLPQIDEMKSAGDVGEAINGFLVVKGELGARLQALVEAENADRRVLYAEVASRTGQTVEEVGQQRAIQIATRAKTGVWLQRPNGEWYRK